MDFIKTKKFKLLAVATSIVAVLVTFFGVDMMKNKTSAVNLESPFYSNELGDNMFTVPGYGDLFVNIIRKNDGTGSGPLAFCLNKQKAFPTSGAGIIYQSVENDTWTWELDNTRTPTAKQVAEVKRALYAYKYVWPEKLTSYGLEAENTMALYHANQIAEWAILEDWTPSKIAIKEDVKTKPQMYEYAKKIQRLFTDMLSYAQNTANVGYTNGINVVLKGTSTPANYNYKSTDYITTSEGKGYLRSGLMQALPKQKAGYYIDGDFGFTYKVSLEGAPAGSRIVNEYGGVQDTFSTKQGVGLNFYIDIPISAAAGKSGNFKANIQTTMFRRNAGILWRPATETAYQTLLQNASIPDSAKETISLGFPALAKLTQVNVLKSGEQLNSFTEVKGKYGTEFKPVYKVLPLAGTKYTIAITKEDSNYFIDGDDGNTYVDGQNLIQKGNVVTGADGIAQFNKLPLDKNRDTTSYRVTETAPSQGFTIGTNTSKIVQVNKTTNDSVVKGNTNYQNERIKVFFNFKKSQEYIANTATKEISTKDMQGAVFGIFANENITAIDGKKISKDALVGTVTSDKNGNVNSSAIDLPTGHKFYVKEVATSDSLALSTEIFYLDTTVANDKTDNSTSREVKLKDKNNANVTNVVNHLKKGSLSVEKQVESLNAQAKSVYTTISNGDGFEFNVYSDAAKAKKVATLNASSFKNGKFVLDNLTPGDYFVEETKASANYTVQKGVKQVSVKALETTNLIVKNDLKESTHKLVKHDITDGKRKNFGGVTFDIKYNGIIVSNVTTKDNGEASFKLKNGYTYVLSERVPSGFEKVTDAEISVVGGTNNDKAIEVENREVQVIGSLAITKEDTLSKKTLSNVGFAIYRQSDKNFEAALAEDVTDKLGVLKFNGLAPDVYVVVETVPLPGYLPVKNTVVDLTKIKNNETVKITVQNEKFLGDINVTKVDSSTNKPLANATLGLFANESAKSPIATIKSNEKGLATFAGVPYGMYYIGEISAPTGYELSTNRVLVDLTNMSNKTVSVTFKNKPINGNLKIIKRDTDKTDKTLESAVFKLYESDKGVRGAYVTTLTTGKDGTITYEGIYQREYILEEVSAPLGYVISNKDIVVDASKLESGQTIEATIYNKKQTVPEIKGSISVNKVDITDKTKIDATFVLLNELNEIVDTKETKDGTVTFENLKLGKYSIIEKVAPKGYSVNETIHKVTLTALDANQTILVEDKKVDVILDEATIIINKYDSESKKPLEGVEFNIFKKGSADIFSQGKTNKDGQIVLNKLANGFYTIVESKPLSGYIHSDVEYTVEINDTNRTGVVSAYNIKEAAIVDPIPDPKPDVKPDVKPDPKPTTPDPKPDVKPDVKPAPEIDIPEVKKPVIEIPNTGVNGKVSPFMIGGIVMVAAAAAGFIFLALKTRKDSKA